MNPCVKQMRDSIRDGIKRNRYDVSYFLNNSLITEHVRLAHESASVPTSSDNPVGLGTSYSLFVEAEYNTQIFKGAILIENGNGWKVGEVDSLKVEEKVYMKRSPLTQVTLGTTKSITSFKIGSVAGTINQSLLTVAITLPSGTDVTALTPTIVHTGKMISPTIAQDFTTPKTYTITAENLTTQTYTVTVTVAV